MRHLKTWAIFLDVRPFYGLRFFIHAPQELGLFCISLVLVLFATFKPATQMYLHIQFLPHSKHTVLADQLSVLSVLRTIPNAQYIACEMDSVRYFQYRWYIYLPLSFRGLIVVFPWP
jgi:ABC-type glycerol-3-phosphate transport system permease component